MGYRMIDGKPYLVRSLQNSPGSKIEQKKRDDSKKSFNSLLKIALKEEKFKISNHAKERLKNEKIDLKDYESINKGFDILDKKGCKNAVMIIKEMALIANIKNKTIITAVSKERAKENVFTNIDSVVIL